MEWWLPSLSNTSWLLITKEPDISPFINLKDKINYTLSGNAGNQAQAFRNLSDTPDH